MLHVAIGDCVPVLPHVDECFQAVKAVCWQQHISVLVSKNMFDVHNNIEATKLMGSIICLFPFLFFWGVIVVRLYYGFVCRQKVVAPKIGSVDCVQRLCLRKSRLVVAGGK